MIRGKFQQVGEKETEIFDVQLVREDTRDQIKQKLFQEISRRDTYKNIKWEMIHFHACNSNEQTLYFDTAIDLQQNKIIYFSIREIKYYWINLKICQFADSNLRISEYERWNEVIYKFEQLFGHRPDLINKDQNVFKGETYIGTIAQAFGVEDMKLTLEKKNISQNKIITMDVNKKGEQHGKKKIYSIKGAKAEIIKYQVAFIKKEENINIDDILLYDNNNIRIESESILENTTQVFYEIVNHNDQTIFPTQNIQQDILYNAQQQNHQAQQDNNENPYLQFGQTNLDPPLFQQIKYPKIDFPAQDEDKNVNNFNDQMIPPPDNEIDEDDCDESDSFLFNSIGHNKLIFNPLFDRNKVEPKKIDIYSNLLTFKLDDKQAFDLIVLNSTYYSEIQQIVSSYFKLEYITLRPSDSYEELNETSFDSTKQREFLVLLPVKFFDDHIEGKENLVKYISPLDTVSNIITHILKLENVGLVFNSKIMDPNKRIIDFDNFNFDKSILKISSSDDCDFLY